MSYFTLPPEREPTDMAIAEWWRSPRDELGAEIPLDRLIAESQKARLSLLSLVIYSNGLDVRILGEWRQGALEVSGHTVIDPRSEAFVRVGVEFSDGRRATNLDWGNHEADDAYGEDADSPPEKPHMAFPRSQVLNRQGCTNIGDLWVWGLPPQGDLLVVCEWPAVDIPVTQFAVGGDLIRATARQSLKLWS